MKIYATQSSNHLTLQTGGTEVTRFADGEVYVRVLDNPGKTCIVLGSFPPPAENILELFFLLDALTRMKTKIVLVITYFGYARQDKLVQKGEALGVEVIANILKQFPLQKIFIVHPHSAKIGQLLSFTPLYPFSKACIKDNQILIAPDMGAYPQVKKIGGRLHLPTVFIEKHRTKAGRVVRMKLTGSVKDKRVLIIDDIIASGTTIIKAADLLMKRGARSVDVYATHGLFSENAVEKIERSGLRNITVTDTLPRKKGKRIQYHSLVPFLKEFLLSLMKLQVV